MIRYYKLFDLLNRRGMKKSELLNVISAPTLGKLQKGEIVKTDTIDKICKYLKCQPENIMEVYETITYTNKNGKQETKEIPVDYEMKEEELKKLIEEAKNYINIQKGDYIEVHKKIAGKYIED